MTIMGLYQYIMGLFHSIIGLFQSKREELTDLETKTQQRLVSGHENSYRSSDDLCVRKELVEVLDIYIGSVERTEHDGEIRVTQINDCLGLRNLLENDEDRPSKLGDFREALVFIKDDLKRARMLQSIFFNACHMQKFKAIKWLLNESGVADVFDVAMMTRVSEEWFNRTGFCGQRPALMVLWILCQYDKDLLQQVEKGETRYWLNPNAEEFAIKA